MPRRGHGKEFREAFDNAPEGWYIILKNAAEGEKHPAGSGKLTTPTLRIGKKVNISGPASFALRLEKLRW
jgi:hypothetical protein